MNHKKYAVRIVKSPSNPVTSKRKTSFSLHARNKSHDLYKKIRNIFAGSSMGLLTGLIIYVMLKTTGVATTGLESSIIIAFPAILGIITSFVIF